MSGVFVAFFHGEVRENDLGRPEEIALVLLLFLLSLDLFNYAYLVAVLIIVRT